jgi:SSS family solute:Na+ symporter
MGHFRRTVVLYPLCLFAIWLPCTYVGVMANRATEIPRIQEKIDARRTLASEGPRLTADERAALRAKMAADDVMIVLLEHYAPVWMAGILGAGIMAAVMASDSQILALSTMFTEDVFAYYGGKARFGETVQVHTGRLFVIGITVLAYLIALEAPASIFDLAVQYAFSGFSAMVPLLVAALFWRRSTKWGALAATLWTGAAVIAIAVFQQSVPPPAPGTAPWVWRVGGLDLITRTPAGTAVLGLMPVVPMTLISAALLIIVSWVTPRPGSKTIERYFSRRPALAVSPR